MKTIKKKGTKYTKQEKILLPIFHFILLFFAIYELLPFVFVIINSFKGVDEYYVSAIKLPVGFEFKNYIKAFDITYKNTNVIGMFFNTLFFVITFSFGSMSSSIITAYVLSRFRFLGRGFLYGLSVTIQVIPVFGTLGASYQVLNVLGMIDNIWLLWISGANGFTFTFLIVFSYFENIDSAYAEAAKMDGAGNFTIFIRVMVPMAIPAVMTMWLSNFIALWNDYSTPLIFLPNHPTLSTGIYNLKSLTAYIEGGVTTYFAAIVLAMIPILLLFIAFQKRIFKINVDGGIKG